MSPIDILRSDEYAQLEATAALVSMAVTLACALAVIWVMRLRGDKS